MLAIVVQESEIFTSYLGRVGVFGFSSGLRSRTTRNSDFGCTESLIGRICQQKRGDLGGKFWSRGCAPPIAGEGQPLDGSEGVPVSLSAAAVANRVPFRSACPFPSATEPDCWKPGGMPLNGPCRLTTHGRGLPCLALPSVHYLLGNVAMYEDQSSSGLPNSFRTASM